MQLIIDKNSLRRTSKGSITGVIYFDFGEIKFPEIGWDDFVVVIVGWWITSLLKLFMKHSITEDLLFMDGPLAIRLAKKEETLLLECINRRLTGDFVGYSQEVSLQEFTICVLNTGKNIIEICKDHNWKSKDIDDLTSLILQLDDRVKQRR